MVGTPSLWSNLKTWYRLSPRTEQLHRSKMIMDGKLGRGGLLIHCLINSGLCAEHEVPSDTASHRSWRFPHTPWMSQKSRIREPLLNSNWRLPRSYLTIPSSLGVTDKFDDEIRVVPLAVSRSNSKDYSPSTANLVINYASENP